MKAGVVIGKFNIIHEGHERILSAAAANSDKILVITPVVRYRSIDHFFLDSEVETHLKEWFKAYGFKGEVVVAKMHNTLYDDGHWAARVNRKIRETFRSDSEITLFGCKKDRTSFYLDFFPLLKRELIEVTSLKSSTDIRRAFMAQGNSACWSSALSYVYQQTLTPHLEYFRTQLLNRTKYIAQYGPGPHLAGDAVVYSECPGDDTRVLFIRRTDNGRLAFPGGFLDPGETFTEAILREMKEELGVIIFPPTSEFPRPQIFDHPNRSTRGSRVITGALKIRTPTKRHIFDLNQGEALEVVWLSYEDALKEVFHDDHFSIAFNLVYKHDLIL